MAHRVHQELKDYLLKIYHKDINVMPEWDIIADIILLAKMEPTFENVRFATHLYYVIDDLLHPVKHVWATVEEVNEADETISIVSHEIFEYKVGTVDSPVLVYKPEKIVWDSLYKGRTPAMLNENVKSYPVSKFHSHFEAMPNPADDTRDVRSWLNFKDIQEKYKAAFEPVIDRNIPRISFERFIERLPEFAGPFGAAESVITHYQYIQSHINITAMPNFLTEIRETFDKKYLKVQLKDKSRLEEIQIVIASLPSVKNVNITKNKELDLTVYPDKFFSAEETQKEVVNTLNVIFSGSPADPIIKDDILVGVSADIYAKILKMIHYFGKNLEKFNTLHSKFDEEGFRDYFLPYLNVMSTSHTATGETFNKIGKTDILIQNQVGENIFIAECKVWSGEGNVGPAVDQLLQRYVTWRDEKLALIIFNKTVKGFSAIIGKALDTLKNHPQCKAFTGSANESSGSFLFHHPEDKDKEVRLELLMFNCA